VFEKLFSPSVSVIRHNVPFSYFI